MSGVQVVVGLDVGTTKVAALIGEVRGPHLVEVVGVGISPSRGLKKGLVVDMEEASAAISTALRKAEAFSGYKIIGAYVSISGGHLVSETAHGGIPLPGDRPVSQQELSEVLEAARLEEVPEGREVLHVLPKGYVVDGEGGIRNPIGMLGTRLEVEGLVVSSASAPLHNLARCVEKAGIQIDGFVAAGLASAQGVLSDAERQLGVLLVDLGGGTTDLVWYREGEVQFVGVLPVGGNHLTNDLSIGLGVPFSAAEEIKVRFASSLPASVGEEDTIDAGSFSDGGVRKVSKRFAAEIVEARLDEIFGLASEGLEERGFDGVLPAGVVLAGGGAQLRGIRDLAQQTLGVPVRIGSPEGLTGSIDSISTPAYATGAGLLKWALARAEDLTGARPLRRRVGWGSRVKGLAKVFLP
jgi:cell division protein FtsA